MDFHARIAGLSNALKRIEKRQKIKALRERLKNGDYSSAREAHLIKKQIKRLMTRTASNTLFDRKLSRIKNPQTKRKIIELRDRLRNGDYNGSVEKMGIKMHITQLLKSEEGFGYADANERKRIRKKYY